MRRIIFLTCAFFTLVGYGQQAGDATIQTYVDTYLNTNGTGSITGAELNQGLSYLIDSKVNHDSATTVRLSATKDTIFLTYWGYPEDTILVDGAIKWKFASNVLYPRLASYGVAIGGSVASGYKFRVIGTSDFTDDVTLEDSVYMTGLPVKVRDSVLYFSGDTVYKGAFSYAGDTAMWATNGSDNIYTKPATGFVGIQTATPATAFEVIDSTDNDDLITFRKYAPTITSSPNIDFYRYDGTPSSFTSVNANSRLGSLQWYGTYDAANVSAQAAIITRTSETWSSTEKGTQMAFYTTEEDSATWSANLVIDEHANVEVGYGDVIVKQGWGINTTDPWTPVLAWTGGSPSAPDATVARYTWINETIHFTFYIDGTNDSGSTLTALNVTLPETPDDNNLYAPVPCLYNASSKSTPTTVASALVDCYNNTSGNRKLYISGISITNTSDYTLVVEGFYEITGD